MQTMLTGTLVDALQKKTYGARLTLSEQGTIDSVTPEESPDPVYILPGFVDAHVHIESSMLTPAAFAHAAVVHGTLAAVADPHEIANVLGEEGVELMLSLAKQTPFVFGFGAPSCVSSAPFEAAGAALGPAAVERLLRRPEITHLAEVMTAPGALSKDPEALAKLAAARSLGKPIDGHAPGLSGPGLQAYVSAGITTDHESLSFDEAREKIKAGLKLQIRHGSSVRPFESFIPLLARYPDRCMFCSDVKHPDDLLRDHINFIAATAYRKGISLYAIIQAASINPVQHYRLPLGLLQPGDPADFLLIDDLQTFRPREVWLRGQCVARDGRSFLPLGEPCVRNRFAAGLLQPEALRITASAGRAAHVIGVHDGQLVSTHLVEQPAVVNGFAVADTERDIVKLVVYNRYGGVSPAVALVKGFGLKRGALASSVAHDAHHIIAVGTTDDALAAAINEVVLCRGGLAVADNNRKVLKVLPLPLAGLISTEPAEAVARAYSDCNAIAKILGTRLTSPFMTLSFLAQPGAPNLSLTDKGLFDGETLQQIPLFDGV